MLREGQEDVVRECWIDDGRRLERIKGQAVCTGIQGEIGLNLHRAVVAQTVELGEFSFHFQSSFLSSNWHCN